MKTYLSPDSSKWITPHGSTAITLHGQPCHFLSTNGDSKGAIEYFTHQNLDEAIIQNVPENIYKLMNAEIYKIISDELRCHNPWVQDCVSVGEYVRKNADKENNDYMLRQMNSRSSKFDVGSLSTINPTGNRSIVYVIKDEQNREEFRIDSGLSNLLEPLGYPLFFVNGENGWSWKHDRKIIDLRSYICSKIFIPEKDEHNNFILRRNKLNTKDLKVNRFNICCKLLQQYLCDMVSRLEDFRLKFIERKNQQLFGNNELIESSITDADYLGFVNNENNLNNVNVIDNNDNNNIISDCIDDNNINNDNVSIINENINISVNDNYTVTNNEINTNYDNITNDEQPFGIFMEDIDNDIENDNDDLDDNNNDENNLEDNDEGPSSRDKKKIYLTESVHGGRMHLKNISQNALSVLAEYGAPTGFLTFTTNSNWDEILENICEDQDGFVRVDVTSKVFKGKIYNAINNLKAGKYFGGAVPVYIILVFEWQERGLPHCHIVFKLTNHPNNKADSILFIEKYIRTDRNINKYDEKYTEQENLLYQTYVTDFMMHKCYPVSEGGCRYKVKIRGVEIDMCKRKYNDIETPVIDILENGYPQYRRLRNNDVTKQKRDDLRVVAHNREILKGHCNFEFVGAANVVLYLYKYLFKGSKNKKMAILKVNNNANECNNNSNSNSNNVNNNDNNNSYDNNNQVKNQVVQYISGRYISSAQAMWRCCKFQTYPSPLPSVSVIKISTLEEVNNHKFYNKTTHMELYLCRPIKYSNLTYLEFWIKMSYSTKLTQYAINCIDRYYEQPLVSRSLRYYVMEKKSNQSDNICRIHTVGFRAGEKFYLRLIMNNICIPIMEPNAKIKTYFNTILTNNNKCYDTYQECAVSLNIVEDFHILYDIFTDYQILSGFNMRLLFVKQTYDGWPTKVIFEDIKWQTLMCNGIKDINNSNIVERKNILLKHLDEMLYKNFSKRISDYGFPKVEKDYTELSYIVSKNIKKNHQQVSVFYYVV